MSILEFTLRNTDWTCLASKLCALSAASNDLFCDVNVIFSILHAFRIVDKWLLCHRQGRRLYRKSMNSSNEFLMLMMIEARLMWQRLSIFKFEIYCLMSRSHYHRRPQNVPIRAHSCVSTIIIVIIWTRRLERVSSRLLVFTEYYSSWSTWEHGQERDI